MMLVAAGSLTRFFCGAAAVVGTLTTLGARQLVESLDVQLARPIPIVAPATDSSPRLLATQIARTAHIPLGFEEAENLLPTAPDRPNRPRLPAITARQALDDLIRMDSRYEWHEVDGVVVIRPVRAWKSKDDALNFHVVGVNWEQRTVSGALADIVNMLGYKLAPVSPHPNEHVFAVKLDAGTVLGVLNATTRAHGELAWFVRYRDEEFDAATQNGKVAFEVGFLGLDGSGQSTLSFQRSPVPRSPRE